MVSKISGQITNRWIRKKIIQEEESTIYQFGLEHMIISALQIVVIVGLGMMFRAVIECIIFVVAFAWLRSYAGGYHASTRASCFVLTTIIIILGLSVIKLVEISNQWCMMLLGVSGIMIFILTPVEVKNKPLDRIETIIYREKSLKIWLAEIVCALLGMMLGMDSVVICITLAHMVLGISLIAGSVR